jgi:hypothetical protein
MKTIPPSDAELDDLLRARPASAWPAPDLRGRVLATLSQETSAAVPVSASPWGKMLAAAALVAGVAGLGLLTWSPGEMAESPVAVAAPTWPLPDPQPVLAAWPELLARAEAPYRREWAAVREDLTASGDFLLDLVAGWPDLGGG